MPSSARSSCGVGQGRGWVSVGAADGTRRAVRGVPEELHWQRHHDVSRLEPEQSILRHAICRGCAALLVPALEAKDGDQVRPARQHLVGQRLHKRVGAERNVVQSIARRAILLLAHASTAQRARKRIVCQPRHDSRPVSIEPLQPTGGCKERRYVRRG